jgi:hypothetical protein
MNDRDYNHLDRCPDDEKAAMIQRLIVMRAKDGWRLAEYASFRCPRCQRAAYSLYQGMESTPSSPGPKYKLKKRKSKN